LDRGKVPDEGKWIDPGNAAAADRTGSNPMSQFITPINFDGALDEWADHFRRKSFTLARATMMDACEYYTRRPETWFLLALTELAARDVKNAEDHLRYVSTMLESGDFDRADFFRKYEPAMRQLIPWILRGLENRSLYAAPYDPWAWLDNWEEVVKVRPSQASALSFQPLGRTESLLGGGRSGEMPTIHRLMDQLKVEPVKVETMQSLLGRDAKISIDKARIRIMDNTVVIEKPLLLAADGTYKPLRTVDVQRPRWDAEYKPPPRTVSDLAPAFQLPPLPKMEPVTLAPVSALPPVKFERPEMPSMEALSLVALPGATPVDMTPFVIERPPIPEAPEMEALRRANAQPVPAVKFEVPPPPKPTAPPPVAAPVPPPSPKAEKPAAVRRPPQVARPEPRKSPAVREVEAPKSVAPPIAMAAGGAAAVAGATEAAGSNAWEKWEREVEALADSGAVTEALRRASEAVDKYPRSARLEEFLGGLLERSGRVEDAAKSYVEAYRKAKESGATDRAKRALDRATALAKRSGPLMLEIGALVAALGAVGVAATLLAGAADHYRKSGDRKRLVQILDLLRRVSGTNPRALEELRRLESEVGQVVGQARSLAPQVRAVAGEIPAASTHTHPPKQRPAKRTPVAPRVVSSASGDMGRARRAEGVDVLNLPNHGATKRAEKEGAMGGTLLGVSVFVLFFTLVSGWTLPSVIGAIFSYLQVNDKAIGANFTPNRVKGIMALIVFVLSFLISLIH
jgi:outer membrane biosynthesis protein TonB